MSAHPPRGRRAGRSEARFPRLDAGENIAVSILSIFPASAALYVVVNHARLHLGAQTTQAEPPNRLFGTENITYHKLSALIRIGHKYQMDHLVHQSLDYLRTMYPDDWSVCSKGTPMWRLGQYSIGVVNLARLTGAHHLLPCALMQCCSLGLECRRRVHARGRDTRVPEHPRPGALLQRERQAHRGTGPDREDHF